METILASTSPYRKQLLERLGLPFSCLAPTVDEDSLKLAILQQSDCPENLAQTLAAAKAQSIASSNPKAVVIGSDQLAHLDGQILGKPGNMAAAQQQLQCMSGKTHTLITAVHIACQGQQFTHTDITRLKMHSLGMDEIVRYLNKDQPFNCAGSYKLEAAGIGLFESIESADQSAITGLPLLFVCKILRQLGLAIP